MNKRCRNGAVLLAALLLWCTAGEAGAQTKAEFKLLFSGPADVTNVWGKLHFGATPMQKLGEGESAPFSLACCVPKADGSWDVYGQRFDRGPQGKRPWQQTNSWKFMRATTRDGAHFENVEAVFDGETGPWTDHLGMAYNPEAKEFLALRLKLETNGIGFRAFFSPDGRHWREHEGNPLYFDGDSMGLFWSPAAHRFVVTEKSLQPFLKHNPDHGGRHPQLQNDNLRDRRVLAIRSSADGRRWEPSASLMDIWNALGQYQGLPAEYLTTPDEQDPPDMEFYRGISFWYHDRAYMVVLNYAASPLLPGKHGPQLDTEWWVSRDGLHWDRPYRGLNALGEAFPKAYNITHNPLVINGMMLFQIERQFYGMKADRISYVSARANAEFTTQPFTMPASGLCLNAAIPSPDRPFAGMQAYVMAAVLDESGQPVPGFEREKCLLQKGDQIDLPLQWTGKSTQDLAGRRVSLRFYVRSANIYAVTTKE